jgi:hypothetical protein
MPTPSSYMLPNFHLLYNIPIVLICVHPVIPLHSHVIYHCPFLLHIFRYSCTPTVQLPTPLHLPVHSSITVSTMSPPFTVCHTYTPSITVALIQNHFSLLMPSAVSLPSFPSFQPKSIYRKGYYSALHMPFLSWHITCIPCSFFFFSS